VKLAIVVQRYGVDIDGGAELHARYLAETLARHADVRVFTTCARDYVTWRNELPAGHDSVNGIPVERFHVDRERTLRDFGPRSTFVFTRRHSVNDELSWLASEGPTSSTLVAGLGRRRHDFDYVLFFSIRYYQAYHGARSVADKAILVPTAERDPALGLSIFQPIFRGVRAIMYNSFEERALIHAISHNQSVPGAIVGIGSRIPECVRPDRFRQKYGITGPFILYVGRIDANKGCSELFAHFTAYAMISTRPLSLVLIGTAILPIPDHPRLRHLGYVSDEDKFDAIAAADVLVMPSYYESLSMVSLEAWALGRPVLVNAKCDVLVGQAIRSNGGLFYQDGVEFAGALDAILDDTKLAAALGRNGRRYFERHYSWPVIERKYLEMFARLDGEAIAGMTRRMEPLAGWWTRRQRRLPPAQDVIDALPFGLGFGTRATRGTSS
jgi:glycosyltransferase involved in cell wall biosynthesis